MRVCTNCGRTDAVDSHVYCNTCGYPLGNLPHCNCGAELLPEYRHCPACGEIRTVKFAYEEKSEKFQLEMALVVTVVMLVIVMFVWALR